MNFINNNLLGLLFLFMKLTKFFDDILDIDD